MAVSLWQSSRMASQTLVDGNTVADRLQRYVERPSPYWLALASEGVYSLSKPVNLQKISIASKTSEKNLEPPGDPQERVRIDLDLSWLASTQRMVGCFDPTNSG